MRITDVAVYRIEGKYEGPQYAPGDRQAQQLDIYPEYNNRPRAKEYVTGDPIATHYLEIETDEGVTGLYGTIEEAQAYIILQELKPLLIGMDPLAIEKRYDQMARFDRHGRSGLIMTAISAVDLALWDLKGKAWGQPVHRLLGGPVRTRIPAYASMLFFSMDPDNAAETSLAYRDMGYSAQKWFFRYGPGNGDEGMAKNLAMAYAVREAVGDNYTLMFDAFMGWSTKYALGMAKKLAPLQPYWLEEPIPPERFGSLRKIREDGGVPIASGEHVYTRWQTKELLVQEAVDVLQNDPDWTGGITEQMKICALASAFECPVVAHGHSLIPPMHIAAATPSTVVPFVEFLVRVQPVRQFFQKIFYQPVNGQVEVPNVPGLGVDLDEAKIEQRTRVEVTVG